DVAGHRGADERDVPRPGRERVGDPAAWAGGPVPGDDRVEHHQVGVGEQDAAAAVQEAAGGGGRVPVPDRYALEHDPDRVRGGAEHVEDPVLLLAVDDAEASVRPMDRHRVGDVKVALGVAVLARAGEGDLVDAGGQQDHVGPGVVVGRGDRLP